MTSDEFAGGRFGGAIVLACLAAAFTAMALLAGLGFGGGSIAAAQYQYGKVTICHHTHSRKHPGVTITVSVRALPAHLRHGDTIGPCAPPAIGVTGVTGSHGNGHHDSSQGDDDSQGVSGTSGTSNTAPGASGDHGNSSNAPGHNTNGHGD